VVQRGRAVRDRQGPDDGTDANNFGPQVDATREQLVGMLFT